MKTKLIRVAVNNNFNCTNQEFAQLTEFHIKHPDDTFFINANIHTPNLHNIIGRGYKAVITANPNLTENNADYIIDRLQPIKESIAFIRIKFLPNRSDIMNLITRLSCRYPIVITLQRFNTKCSLEKHTQPSYYDWKSTRYRLNEGEKGKLLDAIHDMKNVYICDKKGKGCQSCGLCSKLVTGRNLPVYSLNLSSSGECPYDCPDCFAKTMSRYCVAMGNRPIEFDTIHKNKKQLKK